MTTPVYTDDPVATAADRIRSDAEAAYSRVRSNGDYTTEAIQRLIAVAYAAATDKMTALQERTDSDASATLRKATQDAFGTADLARDPGAAASVAIAARDAADRAAQITDPRQALDQFTQADARGDETMCRALAQQAWAMSASGIGGPAWAELLDAFVATRPRAEAAINTLIQLNRRSASATLADAWRFVLPKPSELGSLGDYQIRALAASAA